MRKNVIARGVLLIGLFPLLASAEQPRRTQYYRLDCKVYKVDNTNTRRLIETPTLVTAEGVEASFLDGGEIAVVGQNGTVQFVPHGFLARMKASNTRGEKVRLEVQIES